MAHIAPFREWDKKRTAVEMVIQHSRTSKSILREIRVAEAEDIRKPAEAARRKNFPFPCMERVVSFI